MTINNKSTIIMGDVYIDTYELGEEHPSYNISTGIITDMNDSLKVHANLTNGHTTLSNVSVEYIIGFSIAFFAVGITGIIGNALVVYIILNDRKMRHSLTNMLIVNLALADTVIMVFGVPEIVQFMLNRGWIIGEFLCKFQRSLLVVSLYVSVMTLVALCIERYIAIVFPIKAHLLCTRKHTVVVIIIIWMSASAFGVPTMLYNTVQPSESQPDLKFCRLIFPGTDFTNFIVFKYVESAAFYIIPLLIQMVCYIVIGKHLFVGIEELHSSEKVDRRRLSEAVKARRGVVKMLIASVTIYFLSYSPHQVLLFYNTFSGARFHQTWVYLVCVNILAYVNSAANPILYCIFSENFRRHFGRILLCSKCSDPNNSPTTTNGKSNVMSLTTEYTVLVRRSKKYNYGVSRL